MDGSLGREARQLTWPHALRLDLSSSWDPRRWPTVPCTQGGHAPGERGLAASPLSRPAPGEVAMASPGSSGALPTHASPDMSAAAQATPPAPGERGYGAPAATLHPRHRPGLRQGSPPPCEDGRCVSLARGVGPACLPAGRGPLTLGDGGRAHIGTHGLRRLAFKRKRNPTNAARVREVQVKTERLSGVSTNGRLRGHLGPSARRPALRAWSGTGLRVPVSTPSGAEIVTLP